MCIDLKSLSILFVFVCAGFVQGASIIGEWTGVADGREVSGGFEIDLDEEGVFYIDNFPVTELMIDEFELNETNYKEYPVTRVWYSIDGERFEPSSPSVLHIRDQQENHGAFGGPRDFFRVLNAEYNFSLTDQGDHTEARLLSSHDLPRSTADFNFDGFDFSVSSSVHVGTLFGGHATSFELRTVPEPTELFMFTAGFLLAVRRSRARSGRRNTNLH